MNFLRTTAARSSRVRLEDLRGVGLVEADGRRFTATIAHRDGRHWIVLRDQRATVALRLFGDRIGSSPGE